MSLPHVPLFGTGLHDQERNRQIGLIDLHPILDDRMRLGGSPSLVQYTLEEAYLIFD